MSRMINMPGMSIVSGIVSRMGIVRVTLLRVVMVRGVHRSLCCARRHALTQ